MRNRLSLAVVLLAALFTLALPAAATALPRGFFGIAPQTSLGPADTARMRAGGVETIRTPLSWAAVQPRPNSDFDWRGADALFAVAARDRLEVLPILVGVPRWLSGDERRLPIDSARQRRGWSQL